ncbi:plasma-membrane calcium-translocating P-type ATPase [Sporobacter termitidis DSM 10068]|uniref:P-type Ca(2+) transporter n=1 Tax=Sporobacter termitidis DSM 10068 TaxID=1123282 RepID=A0A1M5YC07_9FIRM|nr:calcium-translocating P-type ATPase, PMCA-type [Sporobacter termitidis]SHI09512.1 plasma-membrane calcium-translocating P-type ATPase [Sporobacter termitidis DSM 10068]
MNQQNTMELLGRIKGLSESDVHRSKAQHGDNALVRGKKRSFFGEFISNFGDPIIKILLVALVVNIVIRLRNFNWYETIGIALAILVSTFVSTLSEYGSESAFEKLQEDALKTKCRVKRAGGLMELPVSEVVVGDTVLLQPGDRIPADGVITSGELHVDQSPLNGESKEIIKRPGTEKPEDSRDFTSKNRLFRGCIVCSGEAIMRVDSVGAGTFYGRLALDIQEGPRESPLKLRLGKLARTISRFGYIGAALVAIADLFNSIVIAHGSQLDVIIRSLETPKELFGYLVHAATLAISVIVVAIPEGLPLMITIVLSSNMKRMMKDNVLVRKLVGIETSGNLNILFTDKTGTITKGKLKANFFISGNGTKYEDYSKFSRTELGRLMRLSGVYNTSAYISGTGAKMQAVGGNATERALLEFVMNDKPRRENVRVAASMPFSSANKFSSVQLKGDVNLTLVKGAPELVLPNCSFFYDTDGVKRDFTSMNRLKKLMADMAADAVRFLAVAVCEEDMSPNGMNRSLTLLGVVGIRDEIRREAAKAIRQVTSAGIQVVMITGDSKETASAIAREVGLIKGEAAGAVLTSDALQRMSDRELKDALPRLRVVARAVPSDKSRLINLAQDLGLVAGMTGDGINDAPALKKADVGFAMGSGTEVAKEAGDIVILDDNFLSISKAILYGRTIFKSIRKFIIFQLTINLCAVAISIIGPFIGINSPITVLQMLWVNMVMDTLAGLAFAGETPLKEYMNEPPKRRDEPIINKYMYNQILVGGIYTTLLCILFLKLPAIHTMYSHGTGDEFFMTAFFAMFIFAGVFNSFNARTTRLNLLAHIWGNKGFLAIMLLVTIIQIVIIYFGGAIFRTTGLRYSELQFVIILAFSVIPVDFIRKSVYSSKHRGNAI